MLWPASMHKDDSVDMNGAFVEHQHQLQRQHQRQHQHQHQHQLQRQHQHHPLISSERSGHDYVTDSISPTPRRQGRLASMNGVDGGPGSGEKEEEKKKEGARKRERLLFLLQVASDPELAGVAGGLDTDEAKTMAAATTMTMAATTKKTTETTNPIDTAITITTDTNVSKRHFSLDGVSTAAASTTTFAVAARRSSSSSTAPSSSTTTTTTTNTTNTSTTLVTRDRPCIATNAAAADRVNGLAAALRRKPQDDAPHDEKHRDDHDDQKEEEDEDEYQDDDDDDDDDHDDHDHDDEDEDEDEESQKKKRRIEYVLSVLNAKREERESILSRAVQESKRRRARELYVSLTADGRKRDDGRHDHHDGHEHLQQRQHVRSKDVAKKVDAAIASESPNADEQKGEAFDRGVGVSVTSDNAAAAAETADVAPAERPASNKRKRKRKHVRKPTFAEKLMNVLSTPERCSSGTHQAIAWLPSGLSFVISNPKAFIATVLPAHFKTAKFESFTRKLNRWGFKRINHGGAAGEVAYRHRYFRRDAPDLCKNMTGGKRDYSTTDAKAEAVTKIDERRDDCDDVVDEDEIDDDEEVAVDAVRIVKDNNDKDEDNNQDDVIIVFPPVRSSKATKGEDDVQKYIYHGTPPPAPIASSPIRNGNFALAEPHAPAAAPIVSPATNLPSRPYLTLPPSNVLHNAMPRNNNTIDGICAKEGALRCSSRPLPSQPPEVSPPLRPDGAATRTMTIATLGMALEIGRKFAIPVAATTRSCSSSSSNKESAILRGAAAAAESIVGNGRFFRPNNKFAEGTCDHRLPKSTMTMGGLSIAEPSIGTKLCDFDLGKASRTGQSVQGGGCMDNLLLQKHRAINSKTKGFGPTALAQSTQLGPAMSQLPSFSFCPTRGNGPSAPPSPSFSFSYASSMKKGLRAGDYLHPSFAAGAASASFDVRQSSLEGLLSTRLARPYVASFAAATTAASSYRDGKAAHPTALPPPPAAATAAARSLCAASAANTNLAPSPHHPPPRPLCEYLLSSSARPRIPPISSDVANTTSTTTAATRGVYGFGASALLRADEERRSYLRMIRMNFEMEYAARLRVQTQLQQQQKQIQHRQLHHHQQEQQQQQQFQARHMHQQEYASV